MQAQYRSYQQQTPSRTTHGNAGNRRGPMVAQGRDPREVMSASQQAQQAQMEKKQKEAAKKRAKEPTDKNIPDGVEDVIIGDGVQRYKELRDIERRLDATMTRKRLDIREAVDRNVKRHRTLRIWISNTVEDQPWQSDTLDVDTFDFSTNMDSSYRVKIEGRLLDDDEDDSDDSDEDDEPVADGDDPMDEDKKKKTKTKPLGKLYRLSHFFKAMTVDFDKSRTKDGVDQNVEWKKPSPAPNLNGLPAAADFDQLEFKRGGDENCNIIINLVRDETPERFQLSPYLAAILDTNVGTREEVTMGIWSYIKAMGLADDDEKRTFELDDLLRPLFPRQEKGYWPQLGDAIISHTTVLQPVRLNYTIRVDKEFHENPQPTIYDVQVTVEDPLRAALEAATKNPDYASSLVEISKLDKQLAILVRAISNSKSKHAFLDALSKNPTEFIMKWISSQKRDLEIVAGDGMRGGGEDATNDEWRRGGSDGVWGTENVKEIASSFVK
ncbi:SWI/SNF and RSC complex subunit Ssr3 [Clarireedia jacksonii]